MSILTAGATFSVRDEGGERDLLPDVQGDVLRAATADGAVWVAFALAEHDRYTTLTIESWQGIADRPGMSLHVTAPADRPLQFTELDYMGSFSEREGVRRISWLSPSKHFGVNPPGAFALFEAESDEEHDETLLHIWVNENQPHPNTGGAWDLDYTRQWLADWQATFGKRSQMVVNGESLQELYDLVPYAEKANIDEIYIFTNTWRPDPFWPMTDVNWALNPKVFPNGRADLRAYSDHLAERGIRLALHYVSGGIGLYDPVYVGSHPHSDLAAWGCGTLKVTLEAESTNLLVAPDAGMTWPLSERRHLADTVLRVGDELIVPGKMDVLADGSWLLSGCERGAYNTAAAAHGADRAVRFLVVPYAQNFVPDNSSDLLTEIADNYASLLNECRITHAEFDGAEIHCYDGNYGYIKFAQRIYEKMDHGISGHDSGASAPRCFFEYRFKSTQQALRGKCGFTHGNWLVSFQVDSASRPASTMLDANFFLSQGHWGGAMGISKPEPMFGVTTQMLATHGQTEALLGTLHDWKEACQQLTDAQHALIEDSLGVSNWPMPEASNHRVSDTVYAVERRDDGYELVPTRVMTRERGDIKWQLGQEYGPLSPRQFLRPGEAVELSNAFDAQRPSFVLRVLPAYDSTLEAVPASAVSVDAESVFDDKDFFVEGNEASSVSAVGCDNIDLTPSAFAGLLSAENSSPEAIYHVRDLTEYPLRVDLSANRGLSIELEGDGSGALVLVQLEGKGCRDYVIPIDFEGARTVEIPCGEVSWARADWGWRMGTKTMDYAKVAQCRIGLGMVPANRQVSVRIRRMTALAEQPVPLKDPVVTINDTSLQIAGSVDTGNYLVFDGTDAVDVFDPNWHHVGQLDVPVNDLAAEFGMNSVSVQAATGPWMELQMMTWGTPMRVSFPWDEDGV